MKSFLLPPGLLLGSATSATQIEGGDINNDWILWSQQGRIADGTSCFRAADHWKRFEQDIDLLAGMKHRVYRMGIEWSRIEPEEGVFDETAIEHYRQELMLLAEKGIRPLVTLFHFSLPLWFSRLGGFESERALACFTSYVTHAVRGIGDLAAEYITINEPNVYVTNGYYRGTWPPGKKDFGMAMKIYATLAECHAAAYRIIHDLRREMGFPGGTRVAAAFHVRVFLGASGRIGDRVAARLMDHLFQGAVMEAMIRGVFHPPLGFGRVSKDDRRGNAGKGFRKLSSGLLRQTKTADFLALNYYTRSIVKAKGFSDGVHPDSPHNDLGWEIYPEGLGMLCRRFYEKYGLPVWITENGTCDNNDTFRAKFIYNHLRQVAQLYEKGVPVERYYHWSFLDNFEWLDGESARFGLVHVDFETQQRKVKTSGEFYSGIIEKQGVTADLIREFLDEGESGES